MHALQKLDELKAAIEALERKSRPSNDSDSIERSSITSADIETIRLGIHSLFTDFETDIQGDHHIFQSYKHRRNPSNAGNLLPLGSSFSTVPEEEEDEQKGLTVVTDFDDATFKWLDENYGADRRSTMVSPTQSPLERFKRLGQLVKREIHECHGMGINVDRKSLRNIGSTRLSMCANSIFNTIQCALATPRVAAMMERCWDITEFDIFELNALPEIRDHIVVVFGSYLSQHFTWQSRYHLPVDKFNNFLMAIEKSYLDIPYHNKIHAIDVTHTLMYLCKNSIFAKHLTVLEQLACFLAAVIHDSGHTGQTNQYHVNSQSDLATRYNDRSVLENHHLATAFQLLRDPQNNFLEPLTTQEYRYVRDAVIMMVLGTDLQNHQQQLKRLKHFGKVIEREGVFEMKTFTDTVPRIRGASNEKLFVMELALHLVDISNPCKKTAVSVEWTKRITAEFFEQGDMEKEAGLSVSAGCDRDANGDMAKQSLGFIDYIVLPLWTAYHTMDPEAEIFVRQIRRNRSYWATLHRQTDTEQVTSSQQNTATETNDEE